jgi:hypothetical protein
MVGALVATTTVVIHSSTHNVSNVQIADGMLDGLVRSPWCSGSGFRAGENGALHVLSVREELESKENRGIMAQKTEFAIHV